MGLCPNIPFTPLQPFPLCKMLCHNMIQTIQLHILFQWDQNYFLQSNILFTQYILTPVHPLNTSYIIIYLNTLWVSLCPHTHFTPPWPFPPVQKLHHNTIQTIHLNILFQWDQNYFLQSNILFTQYILTPVHPLNTSYDNNLFEHTLGGFMSTYPFYSSMAISPCPKNYITTQFKLFNYTYYFNGIKIISFSQINFSLNIFEHQSIHWTQLMK